MNLRVRHTVKIAFACETVGNRLGLDPFDIKPATIIGNLDDDVTTFVIGVQRDSTSFRLACFPAPRNIFQTVVGRVANHVGQRILDEFKHLTVKFRIGTDHLQIDFLVHLEREVTNNTRQLRPGIADRLHSGLHHTFLEVGSDVRQTLQRNGKFAVILATNHLQKLVTGQDKLGNQCHQVFKQFNVDADRLGCDGTFLGLATWRFGFWALGCCGLCRCNGL